MFKKLVSNLPFSPALTGQLGLYSKKLRKEEIIRRLGLIFIALALVVQSLILFQPPEPANVASSNDMVYGGLGNSINNFLSPYDSNTRNLKDIINYIGITREEIASSKYSSWIANDKISWGLTPHYNYSQGERQYNITNVSGQQITTVYSRPMAIKDNPDKKILGWIGHSQRIGWFAVIQTNGNLVTDDLTALIPQKKCNVNLNLVDDKKCRPCSGDESIWVDNSSCTPNIIKSKIAANITQGFVNALSVVANANDQISYTINVENTGSTAVTVSLEDNLVDVLEYSTLIDAGGGILNNNTNILSWSGILLDPKTKHTRTFVVEILNDIPSTAQGVSNNTSYDCTITNIFGNSIDIKINCPLPKLAEQIITQLPATSPTESMIFISIIFIIIIYFYIRVRQINKEIRMIRRDTNSGII